MEIPKTAARAAITVAALALSFAARAEPPRLPETDATSRDPLGSGGLHDLPTLLEAESRAIDERERATAEAALVAPPVVGPVLTAAAPVRESEHDVHVRLATPVSEVRHRIVLRNPSRYDAEVRYALAVPPDAALTGLSVRVGEAVVVGEPTPDDHDGYDAFVLAHASPRGVPASEQPPAPTPVARARRVAPDGETGPATIVVDLASAPPESELELVVAYAVAVRERGSVTRLFLPPRGSDLRTVEARVSVEPVALGAPRIWGREASAAGEALPGWASLALDADVPEGGAVVRGTLHRLRCGQRACSVLRVAASRRPPVRERLILLLDASPSTLGPARGRLRPTTAALLAEASPESRVQALSFASRVRELVPEPTAPGAIPPSAIATRFEDTLGSATRFEAAWATARAWAREAKRAGEKPHLVIVGDGGITDGPTARRAFEESRRDGSRISVVNVGDRGTRRGLAERALATGGDVIEAGATAELAVASRGDAALRETLRRLFAPEVNHGNGAGEPLRAGEAVVSVRAGAQRGAPGVTSVAPTAPGAEAVARWAAQRLGLEPTTWTAGLPRVRGATREHRARLAAARCGQPLEGAAPRPPFGGREGPATVTDAPARRVPLSLATVRACAPPAPPQAAAERRPGLVPREVLLENLRSRIVPAARGCLRDDRRGRLGHAVRAVFRFRLEDREVTWADVEGAIDDELRACLLTTIDTLDVPRFEGAIVVRYPIHTERAEEPPVIELASDVAERLRLLFGVPEPDTLPRL